MLHKLFWATGCHRMLQLLDAGCGPFRSEEGTDLRGRSICPALEEPQENRCPSGLAQNRESLRDLQSAGTEFEPKFVWL